MEFQKEPYCTLRTVQARKAFCYQYKDRLYKLALDETHDPKQAANLVVAAFQQAFHRYATKPCPEDCFPFLSASIYLLLATECEDDNSQFAQPGVPARPALYPETNAPPFGAKSYEPDRSASATGRPDETPRHARALRADSSQPLSRQVFDPEHTEYWMPGVEQPDSPAPATGLHPGGSASAGKAIPAESETKQSTPAQDASSPNVSQAYIYNSEIAKKRKSPLLSLLNTFLSLLFLWMLVGLLGRMEILPEWNLGYAWFNLNIFPLF